MTIRSPPFRSLGYVQQPNVNVQRSTFNPYRGGSGDTYVSDGPVDVLMEVAKCSQPAHVLTVTPLPGAVDIRHPRFTRIAPAEMACRKRLSLCHP